MSSWRVKFKPLETIYMQIQKSGTQPPPEEILKQQVLERLISERLQLNMGYNAGSYQRR